MQKGDVMRKIFLLTIFVTLIFSASICAAQDVFGGPWSREQGIDYYIMDETIRDTTPPSAHEYRSFEVSTKLVKDGQVQDILTYSFTQGPNTAWAHRLVGRQNEPVPPTVDDLLFPARNYLFEFCMDRLGWSYEIINGHYY